MIRLSKDNYLVALRRKVVLEYIKKNKRSPSREEIIDLMRQGKKAYPNLDNLGFSGYDLNLPSFKDTSSASTYNNNNQCVRDDLVVIKDKLKEITDITESQYLSLIHI